MGIAFDYVYKGLCGLARAHKTGALSGHLGAAVIAGCLWAKAHPGLKRGVYAGVERQLERIIRGNESLWYDPQKTGIAIPELFEPFPREVPREEKIATLADALAGNIDKTRQSGHNVIFAAIAIRALRDYPEYATPTIVSGIRKLIEQFDDAGPGRGYWGRKKGWVSGDHGEPAAARASHGYDSLEAMANVVVDELIQTSSEHRRGFGGMVHVTNHAAAIIELADGGFNDLAQRGLQAHRQHVRLWRALPDLSDELGPPGRAAYDPRTPGYWRDDSPVRASAHLTHRIKTLYGFSRLLPLIEDCEKRRKAEEHFLYLMA